MMPATPVALILADKPRGEAPARSLCAGAANTASRESVAFQPHQAEPGAGHQLRDSRSSSLGVNHNTTSPPRPLPIDCDPDRRAPCATAGHFFERLSRPSSLPIGRLKMDWAAFDSYIVSCWRATARLAQAAIAQLYCCRSIGRSVAHHLLARKATRERFVFIILANWPSPPPVAGERDCYLLASVLRARQEARACSPATAAAADLQTV